MASESVNQGTCTQWDLCPVMVARRQGKMNDVKETHSIYYEVHGSGEEKIVFISGWVLSILTSRHHRLISTHLK